MNPWATLKDWGRLVSLIEYAARQQSLDSREGELVGLLRSSNSRFRSTALKALRNLRYRSDILIAEVVRIIKNDAIDVETRVLAVEALGHLAAARPSYIPDRRKNVEAKTLLQRLLEESLPPTVAEAVRQAWAACGTNGNSFAVPGAERKSAAYRSDHSLTEQRVNRTGRSALSW